jgi:hypothetical protein
MRETARSRRMSENNSMAAAVTITMRRLNINDNGARCEHRILRLNELTMG